MLKKAKEKLAKVAQKATQTIGLDGILDEFPNTDILEPIKYLSIKLKSVEDIETAVQRFVARNGDFEPIQFLLSDGAKTWFIAEMYPEIGIVVFDADDKETEIMKVTLPEETEDCLGKIQHPTGATIYKVLEAGPKCFKIEKTVSSESETETQLQLRKQKSACLCLAKAFGFAFHDSTYKISLNNKLKSRIEPNVSCCVADEYFQVNFSTIDSQIKAMSLGVGLILTMQIAHPALKNLLRETMIDKE